jgi:hypothetical protein
MDSLIKKVFEGWFEYKHKKSPQSMTIRKRKYERIYYIVDKNDIYEFMDMVGAFVPKLVNLRCSIYEDCILFTEEDLNRVSCLYFSGKELKEKRSKMERTHE